MILHSLRLKSLFVSSIGIFLCVLASHHPFTTRHATKINDQTMEVGTIFGYLVSYDKEFDHEVKVNVYNFSTRTEKLLLCLFIYLLITFVFFIIKLLSDFYEVDSKYLKSGIVFQAIGYTIIVYGMIVFYLALVEINKIQSDSLSITKSGYILLSTIFPNILLNVLALKLYTNRKMNNN